MYLWYKIINPAVCVCRYPVLSQHSQNGVQSCECDVIGPSQDGALGEEPNLRRQVQNFAAHGTVG